MRYLIVYFSSRIVNDVQTFIYTTRKSLKCTLTVGDTTDTFNLSYWDGKPKDSTSVSSGSGSHTMRLSRYDADGNREPLSKEEAYLYREHYGSECVLAIDADGNSELLEMSKFNALPQDEQNIITSEQLHAS